MNSKLSTNKLKTATITILASILIILFIMPLSKADVSIANQFIEIVLQNGQTQDPFTIKNASGSTLLNVEVNGNVGIGATDPDRKLHVYSAGDVFTKIDSGAISRAAQVEFSRGAGNTSYLGPAVGNTWDVWLFENIPIVLGINNSEKMRITASGNVGIGTTTPNQKLTVVGNINLTDNLVATNITAKNIGGVIYADQYATGSTTGGIQEAINALTPGRTWKEKVIVNGNYTITSPISISSSYTILEINGKITLGGSASGGNMIVSDYTTEIDIIGGVLDGNRAEQTGNHDGIYFNGVTKARIWGTKIYNSSWVGISFHDVNDSLIDNVVSEGNGIGINIMDSSDITTNNIFTYSNDQDGYHSDAIRNHIVNNIQSSNNGHAGLSIDEVMSVTISNALLRNNGHDGLILAYIVPIELYGGATDNVISNVVSEGNAWNGIGIGWSDNIIVTNFISKNNSYDGLSFVNSSNILAEGISKYNQKSGMYLNNINNSQFSIMMYDNSLAGNNLYPSIGLDNSHNNTIVNSKTYSTNPSIKPNYGIDIYGGSSGNHIHDNVIKDVVGVAIFDNGVSTIKYQNYGNAGFNFGNSAAAPTPFGEGDTFYNTSSHKTAYYNGTNWIQYP